MSEVKLANVPVALRERPHWILWANADRDGKPTKIPLQANGAAAKSNDQSTWSTFEAVSAAYQSNQTFAGIGFVFAATDPFCGIDLDGCRDPKTGIVADWAREIILRLDSYAEVSPSETGVKIFVRGASPFETGRKIALPQMPRVCDKEPAIEIYSQGRYFAVTGLRVRGPVEPQERDLGWLREQFAPNEPNTPVPDFHSGTAVFERARKYLAKLPGAISGQGGHNATFRAACVLVLGFELSEGEALVLMHEFNQRCQPQWTEKELRHKVTSAAKQTGKRGYLRNTAPAKWEQIAVPEYKLPIPTGPRATTLVDATRKYIDSIRHGKVNFVSTSIPDLDYALGGGLEPGELVIYAARPSHGKSAAALQAVHGWTEFGMKSVIISEEMSSLMLGKRTLQFLSKIPQEHWQGSIANLESDVDHYAKMHAECRIYESCRTVDAVCEVIEREVRENGIQAAAIDYAQLLQSPGKSRYEQITNVSIALRQLASSTKIILLVLCQLNREIESRKGEFLPLLRDIRDSGQLEQDADVICFLCWPFRMDRSQPVNKYQFFVAKNRNRQINENKVTCRFIPDRQMILDPAPEEVADEFDRRYGVIPE